MINNMGKKLKKAMLWHSEKEKIMCGLCARRCLIPEGAKGVCLVRKNIGGVLYSLNYGKIISMNADPMEKKPLFHFLPGTKSFSIASAGCNFACAYCCNWEISQVYRNGKADNVVGEEFSPRQIADMALKSNCKSISYTYTEPAIFFEFAHDASRLAGKAGLKNVFVTNGYMTPEAVKKARYLDAAVVNFKASGEREFYRKYAAIPATEHIFECLKEMKKRKIFLEVTNLVIPQVGENIEAFKRLVKWVAEELGPETPFHILRFFPSYRVGWTETPLPLLESFYEIAKNAGLNYVYLGNVGTKENTFCPSCKKLLVERSFPFVKTFLKSGACPDCGRSISVVL